MLVSADTCCLETSQAPERFVEMTRAFTGYGAKLYIIKVASQIALQGSLSGQSSLYAAGSFPKRSVVSH